MPESAVTSQQVYIYSLIDPRTEVPHYIGKTKNPKRRDYAHCNPRKQDKSSRAIWIRSLLALNLKPSLRVLEVVEESEWQSRERWWIAYGQKEDWPLTNGDNGGWGGRRPTASTITKLRLSHVGKGHSPETRAKMSCSRKGRKCPERAKEKLRERPHTWGYKISVGKMGHQHSDTAKAKMSEAKKRHFDHTGRKADIAIEYLNQHPEDAILSCRKLARKLHIPHRHVSLAKKMLGYDVKSRIG